jgi:hypothetical protein
MTDIAAMALSSPVNDFRLGTTNSNIEGVFTDEDRHPDRFIADYARQQRFN